MNATLERTFIALSVMIFLFSCKTHEEQWEGQGEISKVNTETVPVQRQYKGIFELGNGIYSSNNFDGARLNGISLTNDSIVTALITSENTPVNMSPWYAFKLWSDSERDIELTLSYSEGARHRYSPKISRDGIVWKKIDSSKVWLTRKATDKIEEFSNATMNLTVGPDTLWISAQELYSSSEVETWTEELERKNFVTKEKVGESHEGRPIDVLKIGESDDKAMVVVLSRQHPPEVTGFLAMQAFAETIASDKKDAIEFRKNYNTYVFPLVNPDGVDNGHWRHGQGGKDLNRDWEDFNQPETRAVRDFIQEKIATSGGKVYFFVDFHSTWEDIYYTIDPEEEGNMPGLVPELIAATATEFDNYNPNIKPSPASGNRITSIKYFFHELGAESLTYEIGDSTPRNFVRRKGEVTAMKLMELMQESELVQ